ncbi:MAG: hypothetical protein IJH40_06510 [Ruminococcus sp.]|uniref:alpha/beta hydrolase n=1 Tax=Ruminococcus sp. TaxID=41978 RepID=UPI002872D814|nr:alpha/beta hydrolase-fold protein [Ruminococcus sp.]MBQ3285279.1 hypothetical protein [Ruminococcus sp.]
MKKIIILLLIIALTFSAAACANSNPSTPDQQETEAVIQTESATQAVIQAATIQTDGPQPTEFLSSAPSEAVQPMESISGYDPYSTDNVYDLSPALFERQSGTDYGTLLTDVVYFSTTAADDKRVNILLPPGYDENSSYPVLYMIHGWGGDYTGHLYEGSYLHMLYGNMYRDGLAEPMIIVGVDMYTGKMSVKDDLDGYGLRAAYDKTVDDIAVDLMPFMQANYAVAEGRENTAVAGVSEGGAKSLCTGFQWLDQIGYIAGIAPDGNVISVNGYYSDSYWSIPYFDTLPQPTENTMPLYLYLAVGSEDPYNIYSTQYYSEILTDMGIRHQFDYVEGFAHNSDFWRVCMYNFIRKIFY